MSVTLLTTKIWATLRAVAKRSRPTADVAVAYFGQGAATMLPLPRGSRLVVDASEGAVKSGQTCPAELKKLISRGVHIYSIQNLHAKVFVFGTKAFVGSANVSRHSANRLVEAMIAMTDRKAVSAARLFVRALCVHELGPKLLERLAKMYRPPRLPGGRRQKRASTKRQLQIEIPRVLLAQLDVGNPPKGSEDAQEAGRKVAAKRLEKPRRHRLDEFWWRVKCSFHPGDVVVQVLDEGAGRCMVSPPGTVVHTRAWRRGGRGATFVYVEVPARRRVALDRLARRLGSGARGRLHRGGQVNRQLAERLLQVWGK